MDHTIVRTGSRGPQVTKLKEMLQGLDYHITDFLEDFDNGTALSLKAFQNDHRLSVTGVADEATWATLEKALGVIMVPDSVETVMPEIELTQALEDEKPETDEIKVLAQDSVETSNPEKTVAYEPEIEPADLFTFSPDYPEDPFIGREQDATVPVMPMIQLASMPIQSEAETPEAETPDSQEEQAEEDPPMPDIQQYILPEPPIERPSVTKDQAFIENDDANFTLALPQAESAPAVPEAEAPDNGEDERPEQPQGPLPRIPRFLALPSNPKPQINRTSDGLPMPRFVTPPATPRRKGNRTAKAVPCAFNPLPACIR